MITYDARHPEGIASKPKTKKLDLPLTIRPMTAEEWKKYGEVNPNRGHAKFRDVDDLIYEDAAPLNPSKDALEEFLNKKKKKRELARRLREIQESLGISVNQLSKMIGINPVSIINYQKHGVWPNEKNRKIIENFLEEYEQKGHHNEE